MSARWHWLLFAQHFLHRAKDREADSGPPPCRVRNNHLGDRLALSALCGQSRALQTGLLDCPASAWDGEAKQLYREKNNGFDVRGSKFHAELCL